MIAYELIDLLGERVVVRLQVSGLSDRGLLSFDGPPSAVDAVRSLLIGAPGLRGRFVMRQTTARDLAHALSVDPLLARCRPRIIEGTKILRGPSPSVSGDKRQA